MIRVREDELDDVGLQEIAEAVRKGAVVVFRTDTVYGLGANVFDEVACRRVFEIKRRPEYKPLCALIADRKMLDGLVEEVSPVERRLMDEFWPGPLTLKLHKKRGALPEIVSAGDDFVRVRLLEEGFARRFDEALGVPIVAPSANLSGSVTGTKIENVVNELGDAVDYILDGGDVGDSEVSTIVEVVDERIRIIREGRIEKAALTKVAPVVDD